MNATHREGRGGSFSERLVDRRAASPTSSRTATDTTRVRWRLHASGSVGSIVGSIECVGIFGCVGSGPWGPSRSSGPSGSGTSVRHQWAHHDSRFTIVQGLFFSHPHQHNTLTHTTRVWWCVPREHRSAYYSGSIPSGPSGPSDPSGPSGSSGPSRPSGSSGPSGPSCFFWGGQ